MCALGGDRLGSKFVRNMTHQNENWVFGYGSLIWRPGFKFEQAVGACLSGLHRSLCIYSHRYRGTAEHPGLVFGLCEGGECYGMAFRVDDADWQDVVEYLRSRELITGVYLETVLPVKLASGHLVNAMTFVADQTHEQFARLDTMEQQRALVELAHGTAGSNKDYVLNTINHLDEMGIEDALLKDLGAALRTGMRS